MGIAGTGYAAKACHAAAEAATKEEACRKGRLSPSYEVKAVKETAGLGRTGVAVSKTGSETRRTSKTAHNAVARIADEGTQAGEV